MAFETLFPGDLIEVRAPKNDVKCRTDVTTDATTEKWNQTGLVHPYTFKKGIIGVVIGKDKSVAEKRHGWRFWTLVFTYDCRVVWFPTKHLVLRKRGLGGI